MVRYRHRAYFGVDPALIIVLLMAAMVIIPWGMPLRVILRDWWLLVFWPALILWYWTIVVRGINRAVVVDDEGLWINGEWQIAGPDIAALGIVENDPVRHRLTRVDDTPYPVGQFHFGAGAGRQSAWGRLLEVEGVGRAVVTRDRDHARGSGWPGIVVVSQRSDDDHLRGLRKAWIIGSYRYEDLLEALLEIAPDAVVPATVPDVRPHVKTA